MGRESRIEPWSPLDRRSAVLVSELTGFVAEHANETRCERKPKLLGRAQEPSTWCGRSEQILLNQVGCEAEKASASGVVFFLDFSPYRTIPLTATQGGTLRNPT